MFEKVQSGCFLPEVSLLSCTFGFDLQSSSQNTSHCYSAPPSRKTRFVLFFFFGQKWGVWESYCLCLNGSVQWAVDDGVQSLLILRLGETLWCGGTWKQSSAAQDPKWSLTIIKQYHPGDGGCGGVGVEIQRCALGSQWVVLSNTPVTMVPHPTHILDAGSIYTTFSSFHSIWQILNWIWRIKKNATLPTESGGVLQNPLPGPPRRISKCFVSSCTAEGRVDHMCTQSQPSKTAWNESKFNWEVLLEEFCQSRLLWFIWILGNVL